MSEDLQLISKYESLIKDDFSIASQSVKGVGAKAFFDLSTISGIKKGTLATVVFLMSIKTIQRRYQENKKLNPRNGELTLKLIALYKKGIEVFGSRISFNKWMKKDAFGLGNQPPFSFLSTNTGIDLIFEELVRIEYGDLA